MRPSTNPLRFLAQLSAAVGLLSVTLSGEIAQSWLAAGWLAWGLSWVVGRFPRFLGTIRRLETTAGLILIAMLWIDFGVLHFSIFITITHFLILFQIIKLIGEKNRKDSLQIFIFSFFQVLAACTLSSDAWHAGILLALIPTATAMLFWNQIDREWERAGTPIDPLVYRNCRRMISWICASALPVNILLTVIVFVLFPRLKLNATLPGFGNQHMGYTGQVNLAQKGALQQDSSVALWLNFPRAQERALWSGYLRGKSLSAFDGHQWTSPKAARPRMLAPDPNGFFLLKMPHRETPRIHYTITLIDTSASTLFTIANPFRIRAPLPALQQSEGGNLRWLASWDRPLRYEAVSDSFSEKDSPVAAEQSLVTSQGRVRSLVKRIARKGTAMTRAQNIATYLRLHYRYSTDFGERIPDDPVDYFLFERREGTCAHFASAMAVMLRLENIPSRVIAGYLKGEWNEPAQSVVVRERDAHAWVEAYIEGKGWVSFDPSPREVVGTTLHRQWFHTAFQYLDYYDLQWNRLVIQYDLYSQIKALETLKGTSDRLGLMLSRTWSQLQARWGSPRPSPVGPTTVSTPPTPFPLKKGCAVLLLAMVCVVLIKHRAAARRTVGFYEEFLRKMAREGCPKQEWETGEEFAARLVRQNPEQATTSRDITKRYYHLRFSKGNL